MCAWRKCSEGIYAEATVQKYTSKTYNLNCIKIESKRN